MNETLIIEISRLTRTMILAYTIKR